MAIGRAVMYYDRAAHAISTGFKCRHCMVMILSNAIRLRDDDSRLKMIRLEWHGGKMGCTLTGMS